MALAKNQLLIRVACANCQQAEREKAALAKIASVKRPATLASQIRSAHCKDVKAG